MNTKDKRGGLLELLYITRDNKKGRNELLKPDKSFAVGCFMNNMHLLAPILIAITISEIVMTKRAVLVEFKRAIRCTLN